MPSRIALALLTVALLGGVAHAGKYDEILPIKRVKNAGPDLNQKQQREREQRMGIGARVNKFVENDGFTRRLTSRQFRIGPGGKIVATKTMFKPGRLAVVRVVRTPMSEDELRRSRFQPIFASKDIASATDRRFAFVSDDHRRVEDRRRKAQVTTSFFAHKPGAMFISIGDQRRFVAPTLFSSN